jgi:hypothetical protein
VKGYRWRLWVSDSPWVQAVSWTVGTKLFLFLVGWFATAILPVSPLGRVVLPLVYNLWGRWDSAWFVRVAEQGYVHGWPQNPAFFPLYPILIRAGQLLWPHVSPYTVATVVSWLSDVPLFYALHQLVRMDFSRKMARGTLRQLALYPTAFFLSVAYSEALFMALVVGAFYCARRQQWLWSGLWALLAALTRNEGVFLVIPLGVEWWLQHGPRWHWSLVGLGGGPAGLLAYMAYLQRIGKGALDFMHAEALGWDRRTVPPWEGLRAALGALKHNFHLVSLAFTYTFIDLASAVMLLGAVVVMYTLRYRWSYILWAAIMVLIPLSSVVSGFYSPLRSTARLILPAFPLYILLADVSRRNRWWDQVTSLWFPGLQGLFFAFWVLSYWIA